MKFLIMFLLRVLFLPFTVTGLVLTAAAEYMCAKPDWGFWKEFNQPLIDRLPWSKYTT